MMLHCFAASGAICCLQGCMQCFIQQKMCILADFGLLTVIVITRQKAENEKDNFVFTLYVQRCRMKRCLAVERMNQTVNFKDAQTYCTH